MIKSMKPETKRVSPVADTLLCLLKNIVITFNLLISKVKC